MQTRPNQSVFFLLFFFCYLDRVAAAEPPLEVLRSTETAQRAADHDAQPVAHGLALLHGVGSQDHASSRRQRRNHLPHGPLLTPKIARWQRGTCERHENTRTDDTASANTRALASLEFPTSVGCCDMLRGLQLYCRPPVVLRHYLP